MIVHLSSSIHVILNDAMTRKKITNHRTKKAYTIRERTAKSGRRGQIKGLYKIKREASSYVKRNFGDVIKKLSNQ